MIKKLYFGLLLILISSLLTFTGSSVLAQDDSTVSTSNTLVDQIQLNAANSTDEEDEADEDEDDDGVDNDKESAYEREIEMESDDYKFKIQSSLKNDTNKDKFEIEFDVGEQDNAEIRLKFETEAGSNETQLQYKVKFDEIIEFVDENAPGYQNETVISTYEIGKVGWELLSVSNNLTSGLISINATTSDGVFSLMMRMANNFMLDENVTLSPNSIKIDVLIRNFNFNATGTKLAVKAHMKTQSELKVDDESEDELEGIASNETEVGISSATASGYFSWSDLAIVNGQEVDVISSSLSDSSLEEGEASNKMYYTFNATTPSDIVWDPKIGVVSNAAKALYQAVSNPLVTTSSNMQVSSSPSENISSSVDDTNSDLPGFEIWVFFTLFGMAFTLNRKKLKL